MVSHKIRPVLSRAVNAVGLGPSARRVKIALQRPATPQELREQEDARNTQLILAFVLQKDFNCVDIGSNKGDMLEAMVRYAPEGKHIAYEPLPALCGAVAERFPQATVKCCALSNEAGESEYLHVVTEPSWSGLRKRFYPTEVEIQKIKVKVETLDGSLPPGYVPHFIKIDVEGAEKQVIEGGIQTIRQHAPYVFFEHGRGAADYYSTAPGDLFDLLTREGGLRIFDVAGTGPYSRTQFEEMFELNHYWNFLAHS